MQFRKEMKQYAVIMSVTLHVVIHRKMLCKFETSQQVWPAKLLVCRIPCYLFLEFNRASGIQRFSLTARSCDVTSNSARLSENGGIFSMRKEREGKCLLGNN